MQFKGKSRVPQVQSDTASLLGANYQTAVVYMHDWSFLEGERRHSSTLKAGRHVFPFQLQLEGHLPSSLSIHGGEGGVYYKLRATAVRPVFSSNLHATAPVRVVRTFTTEALEYQQTLELENTWPEKIMYSLMVPHRAWAAGDTVTTLAKFSPMMKGVHVSSIMSSIQEHIKTFTKLGPSHETTRVITTAKHEIRNGRAETTQLNDPAGGVTVSRRASTSWTAPGSPVLSGVNSPFPEPAFPMDPIPMGAQSTSNGTPPVPLAEGSMLGLSVDGYEQVASCSEASIDIGEEEIVTTLPISIPASSIPSHPLDPIIVTHRIRWIVSMTNADGHRSELRCSLPLHILDHTLLEDARLATRATRRLLFGHDDGQQHPLEELELPSYPAHILDRVANAHLPLSPTHMANWAVSPESELSTPSSAVPILESMSPHLSPSHPGSRDATLGDTSGGIALDRVNSELHMLGRAWQRTGINSATPPDSTQGSGYASRASSRAGSPERGGAAGRERPHHHHSIFSLKPFSKVASSLYPGQGKGHSPVTDSAPHSSGSTPASESPTLDAAPGGSGSASPILPRVQSEGDLHTTALLNRSFSEVPDYDIASRGFLGGGVTPLSSTRGLPSYEEAERSQSDGNLAARFAGAPTQGL
ncbi:hypothetical protein JB92DRAFT_2920203 [Gautieria morchelliformis]|nr:hypothetical protein JB92DRAFT_2920203 [Gautieria morchelliformis]